VNNNKHHREAAKLIKISFSMIALMLLCCVLTARSQDTTTGVPATTELKVDIQRFNVTGNTLLSAAEVERIVAPYTGAQKTFADIHQAAAALEEVYRSRGYGVVKVLLPEQDISKGVVEIRVVQPRIRSVKVEGNRHFDNDNVRSSLPVIKEGEIPNTSSMARNLTVLNEHPVKQADVVLRGGESEDQTDVGIRVADDKPWRVVMTLDDTGTSDTGYWRSGIGFQHTNLFNRDHTLSLQYITSPTQPSKVSIYGLGYHMPFYGLNSSLDLVAGYSDVNSGTVQGLFSVAGSGTIYGAHWNYHLPKWGELEQKLVLGLDYRAFKSDVSLAGQGGLVPDITIHPASLTYSGLLRTETSHFNFYGSAVTNISGGNDGTSADFQRSRAGATENYSILRYGISYNRAFLNEWQARVAVNGQYTSNALVAGEQFGLGGPDSVRGYLVREVINDRGYAGQLELYTPDVARKMGLPPSYRARLLAFYDYGDVSRNKALPGEQSGKSIASAGVGARMNYSKNVSLRFDVAQILRSANTRHSGDQRISTALAINF
jgi:hemolysin activation/secretion protein